MTTVHVVALPHTQTTKAYQFCAYTQKVRHFCRMLVDHGHRAILYSGEHNDAVCTEHVPVVSDAQQAEWFGYGDGERPVFDGWDPAADWWVGMNTEAARQIRRRSKPGDVLGIIAGRCQQQLIEATDWLIPLEWGIGYEGVLADTFHVWESFAHMHYVHGINQATMPDGRYFDAVVPNAFDPDDFVCRPDHDGYLLYLGRMTPRKGLAVVGEVAERTGLPLVTAGQGEMRIEGADHRGVVVGDERAKLLAGAVATLVPTTYFEPFGGVAVESMLSGTPAITTDWGAFTETVPAEFRCHTLDDFCRAVGLAELGGWAHLRDYAMRYSLNSVGRLYDAYLERLATLNGAGWYT